MRGYVLPIVLLLVLPVSLLAGSGGAATPTVTPTTPSITWQGAHFEAGAPPAPEACTDLTCDAFTFELDVPQGFWSSSEQGLEVSIRWAVEQDDFELYLYDGDGDQVGASTGSFSMAEGVLVPQAPSGTYTAVVVPLAADDTDYQGLAELELHMNPDGPLLPNLVGHPPHDLKVVAPAFYATGEPVEAEGQRPLSCYPDETLEDRALRCLRFSNTVENTGEGTLEARFLTEGAATGLVDEDQQRLVQRIYHGDGSHEDREAGTYEWHAIHGHVHYEGFAQHWLYWADNGTLAREGAKNGFCMIDVALSSWNEQGNGPRAYSFPACNVPTDQDDQGSWMVQGISSGWADIYTWDLPDQYIDVTGLPDGCYRLVTEADPGATFLEETRDDNRAEVVFELTGTSVVVGPC